LRLRKKPRFDERYYHLYHDSHIVDSLTSKEVNKFLKNPFTEDEINQFLNLLSDEKICRELLNEIYQSNIHKKIKFWVNNAKKNVKGLDSTNSETPEEHEIKINDRKLGAQMGIYESRNEFFQKLTNYVKNDAKPERIKEIILLSSTEKDLVHRHIDKFMKNNRRLTLNLCNKIIENNNDCYYCGIAKMPGIWLASSIRESEKSRIIDLKNSDGQKYSRQEHLVESCSRQLLRSVSKKFLGNCDFSITSYRENSKSGLVRISVPIDKFLIGINITVEGLEGSVNDKLKLIKLLKHDVCPLLDSFRVKEKSLIEKIFQYKMGVHKNTEEKADKLLKETEENFQKILKNYEEIRWGVIITSSGNPICRYEKEDVDLCMKGPDELENLVETCVRQISRKNISDYFGPVEFTLSAYKKLVKITIPVYDKGDKREVKYIIIFTLNYIHEVDRVLKKVFTFLQNDEMKAVLETVDAV